MQVNWLDPEHLHDRDIAGAVALLEAARVVDCPHQIGPTRSSFLAQVRYGWDDDPPLVALARDENGVLVGVLSVSLPHWDNTHLGWIEITVDPLGRRRGIGRELFSVGVDRIRSAGRSLVVTDCWDEPAGIGFAKAMGLDRASEEVVRRHDLRTLDWARLDALYADADRHAAGYELVRIAGSVPDDMLEPIAGMAAAINDAPTDDLDIEDEVFTPERVRTYESGQAAHGHRLYRLVARERVTGELAGHTVIAVEGERPWQGWQHDTSVHRAHRGHRLGLVLKIAMLRWLAEAEPQLRHVDTWNAASNARMIEVNEQLGYRVLASGISWQRHLT